MGYKVVKEDQEPALKTFMEILKAGWNGNAALENSPVGESESNGERAIQTWEGQVRTMKNALETRLKFEILPEQPTMTWLVEYAAHLLIRCQVGSDGRTAQEQIKGRPSRRPVAEFAEKVWYKPVTEGSKLDIVMDEGVYVGVIDRSDEALVAVRDGVVEARDIRRQLEEVRWGTDLVMAIRVTPMAPTAGSDDERVNTFIQPGLANANIPMPFEMTIASSAPRRCKLLMSDFERYGITIGCGGCRAIGRGSSTPVNHSEKCRTRVEKEIAQTPDGKLRVVQFQDRMNMAIAEQIEEQDKARTTGEKRQPIHKRSRIDDSQKQKD